MEHAVGELVRLSDTLHVGYDRVGLYVFFVNFGCVADKTENVVIGSLDHGDLQIHVFESFDKLVDLGLRDILF